jgi:hypothetical protein
MTGGYIYKIPFPNGKNYIGLTTTSLEQRQKGHTYCVKNGDVRCLYNALRKYEMVDTFELVEIDTADTLEELCEKEIGYIIEYNSYYMNKNGYNMTYGGEGFNGYVHTEEDNLKNSERMKKYFENPETRQKHSEITKKYFEDHPDAGKEHGERLKKYFENPEARQKHREIKQKYYKENPDAGKECGERMVKYYEDNPHAREKMSEIKKKHFEDHPDAGKEHGEKMVKYYEDNPHAREQMSEIKKKHYKENPDAGKEHGERMKKYFENPEARQKHREIKKKHYKENPELRRKLSDGKGKNRPFDIFTIDGTFIKTFDYQFEAREYLQKEHHIASTIKISEVLIGTRKNSAGFVFKYK